MSRRKYTIISGYKPLPLNLPLISPCDYRLICLLAKKAIPVKSRPGYKPFPRTIFPLLTRWSLHKTLRLIWKRGKSTFVSRALIKMFLEWLSYIISFISRSRQVISERLFMPPIQAPTQSRLTSPRHFIVYNRGSHLQFLHFLKIKRVTKIKCTRKYERGTLESLNRLFRNFDRLE